MSELLTVDNLKVHYYPKSDWWQKTRIKAVNGVSFKLDAGSSLGIVGESGCGKTSLARALVGLVPVSEGKLSWRGADLADPAVRRQAYAQMRMIFQDPHGSLNPRLKIRTQLFEPLVVQGQTRKAAELFEIAAEALNAVGLNVESLDKYPHQFSGGQKQRLVIARALITQPTLLIADEAVAALDVSVQAQILNLLANLKQSRQIALLFISHNLAAVNFLCTHVVVMYLGRIIEMLPRNAPVVHPYSRMLRNSIPQAGREVQIATGEPPNPVAQPSGCPFHPRCAYAQPECQLQYPELRSIKTDNGPEPHLVACHFAERIKEQ